MCGCGEGPVIAGGRAAGGGGGDPSLFAGTFDTTGATGATVDLVDLAVVGSFAIISAAHVSCVRIDAGGVGQRVASWSVTAFLCVSNAVDGFVTFPNPLEFATGYVPPGVFGAPAPAAASLAFLAAPLVQIAALGVAGETLRWFYRGSLTVAQGAVRLVA